MEMRRLWLLAVAAAVWAASATACWYNTGYCNPGQYRSSSTYCCACQTGRYQQWYTGGYVPCDVCAAGRYNPNSGSSTPSACVSCPAGRYAPGTGYSSCTLCPAGYYSTAGATTASQCPPGRYGTGGSTSSSCTGAVAAGRYQSALGGTSSAPGTYCAAGRYGDAGATSNQCSGACPAGYYCPTGTARNGWAACTTGKYCPEGSGSPLTVPSGYYGTPVGSSLWTATQQCTSGSYCTGGYRYSCPAGRYGTSAGLSSSSCTAAAPPGRYSPAGATAPTLCGEGKTYPAAWYCPGGGGGPVAVPTNYYSTPTSASAEARTGVSVCPSNTGQTCSNGVIVDLLKWTDNVCKEGGTLQVSFNENYAGLIGYTPTGIDQRPGAAAIKPTISAVHVPGNLPSSCAFSAGSITLDSNGAMRLNGALDYESCSRFTLEVSLLLKPADNAASLTCRLRLSVADVNEPPVLVIPSTPFEVVEHAELHTLVGQPMSVVDPDFGDEPAFTIDSTVPTSGASAFRIGSCSGQISVKDPQHLNASVVTSFTMFISVTDLGGLSDSGSFTITVLDVNDPPTFIAELFSFSIAENSPSGTVIGSMANTFWDPDTGDSHTFSFIAGFNTDGAYAISPAGVISVGNAALFDYEQRHALARLFSVVVKDAEGLSDQTDVSITLTDVNEPPTLSSDESSAAAPLTCSVPEDSTGGDFVCTITATDPDEGQTAGGYTITSDANDYFAVDSTTGSLTLKSGVTLDHETQPSVTLVIQASDDSSPPLSASATFTVLVTDVNEPPVVSASPVTVDEAKVFATALPTYTVTDPEGNSVFYTLVDSTDVFSMDPATGRLTTVTALDFETTASYTVTARATDTGAPAQTTDFTIAVTVNDVNEPPVIQRNQQFVVPENAATTVGQVLASDPDAGDSITYTLLDNQNRFSLSASGELSVKASWTGNDYEGNDGQRDGSIPTPNRRRLQTSDPGAPFWILQVRVSDSSGDVNARDTTSVEVRLSDVQEAPVWTRTQVSIPENTLGEDGTGRVFTGSLAATDDDYADFGLLRFTFLSGAGGTSVGNTSPDGAFEVNNVTGVVTTLTSSYIDSATTHTYAMQVSDTQGHFVEASVEFVVTEVNVPPIFSQGTTRSVSVPENQAAGAVIITTACTDEDATAGQTVILTIDSFSPRSAGSLFEINNATGAISLPDGGLNFEGVTSYSLTIKCTESISSPLSATATVAITVTDVEEAPVLTNLGDESVPYALYVPENSADGTATQDAAGVSTLGVTDDDAGETFTWSIAATTEGGAAHPFTIDSNGVVRVAAGGSSSLDYETTPSYTVRVTVTDSAGLTDTGLVTINVQDVNEAPTLTAASRTLAESAALPGTVLLGLGAADVDGDALTLSITSGNDDGQFELAGTSLVLAAALDYELSASHTVAVRATDPEGLTADAVYTVTVTDVNDVRVDYLNGTLVHPTSGGSWVVFSGSNVVRAWGSPAISATYINTLRTVYTSPACEVVTAPSAVRCQTAPGVGGPLTWTLTVDGNVHTVTPTTSYTAPALSAVDVVAGGLASMDALPTEGWTAVELTGTNLGPAGSSLTVRYGPQSVDASRYRALDCAITTAHVAARCNTTAGGGSTLAWTLSVGSLVSAPLVSGSYGLPAIYGIAVNKTDVPEGAVIPSPWLAAGHPAAGAADEVPLSTHGGEAVAVVGVNFGPEGEDVVVTYGPNQRYTAECVHSAGQLAHSILYCRAAAGSGGDHQWVVALLDQRSALSPVASHYEAPLLRAISGPGAVGGSTEGGDVVYIDGDQFGPVGTAVPIQVQYGRDGSAAGEYDAVACAVTVAHERIECLTAPGVGKGLDWKATVDGLVSPVLEANTRYAAPSISTYSGPGSARALTAGGQGVAIDGRNFGPLGTPVERVLYGAADPGEFDEMGTPGTPGLPLFEAGNCSVTVAHREVTCLTAPGAGADLRWVVTIGDQKSVAPTTNYAPPAVTGFAGPGAVDAAARGGDLVRIQGTNFATDDFLERVTYGPSGVEFTARNCTTKTTELIECITAPGVGRGLRWIVQVQGQRSSPSSARTSYALPTIVSVTPSANFSTAGQTVTVRVRNSGLEVNAAMRVRMDGTGLRRPAASDLANAAAAVAAGQTVPTVVSAWAASLPTLAVSNSPGEVVEEGSDGSTDGTVAATPSEVDLVVRLPQGYGVDRDLFVALAPPGSGSSAAVFPIWSPLFAMTYAPPVIVRIAPDRQNVGPGLLRVIAQGLNFCAGVSCSRVLVDGNPVSVTSHTHTEIIFVMADPTSTGAAAVQVEVDGRLSNAVSFDRPVPNINAAEGQGNWIDMPTAGGSLFYLAQVRDINSIPASDIKIWIGPNLCVDLVKRADDPANGNPTVRLECLTPPGSGPVNDIIIDIQNGTAVSRGGVISLGYKAPVVEGLLWVPAAPSAQDKVRRLYPIPTDAAPGDVDDQGIPYGGMPTSGVASVGSAPGLLLAHGSDFSTTGKADLRASVVGKGLLPTPLGMMWNHTHAGVYGRAGYGGGHKYLLEVGLAETGGLQASAPVTFRYAAPRLASVTPSTAGTAGGAVLALAGQDFGATATGPKPTVTVGGRACVVTEATHTTLACTLPAGQGANLPVVVTAPGGLTSTTPDGGVAVASTPFSYVPPMVTSMSPRNGPTSGRTFAGAPVNVTVVGTNFGRGDDGANSAVVWQTDQGVEVARVAANSPLVARWTHSEVEVTIPEGLGTNLVVRVVAGGQTSAPNAAVTFSYDPPSIRSFLREGPDITSCDPIEKLCYKAGARTICPPPVSRGCYPTTGGYNLEILGESFGPRGGSVTIGGKACRLPNTAEQPDLRADHNRIVCTVPPGFGDAEVIAVTVNGRVSSITPAALFSYDPPLVEAVQPNTPDARGELIEFVGQNFGGVPSPLTIFVGRERCTGAQWLNDNRLRCTLPEMAVGPQNVTIYVANRSEPVRFFDWERRLVTECQKGVYYGLLGERCLECTSMAKGGDCFNSDWFHADTLVSQAGWWRFNVSNTDARCLNRETTRTGRPERVPEGWTGVNFTDRDNPGLFTIDPSDVFACPYFAPCEPVDACVGANLCAVGYEGDRCGQCLKGEYYRINGLCERCPDQPWLIFVGFFVVALMAAGFGYMLNSKQVNIGMISIGTDYFQVLALFSATRVDWPPLLRSLFNILSAFNLNLELAAPECISPNITVEAKFFLGYALPFAVLVLLAIGNYAVVGFNLCIKGRRLKASQDHTHTVISMGVILIYFLYMYYARLVLDVLNCVSPTPPDGKTYMSGLTDIECWVSPTHITLVPFAILGIGFYLIGVPVLIYVWLRAHKLMVKADQILRARGVEDVRSPEMSHLPEMRVFRRRWHRLYYLFRPGKWHWIVTILARKAGIAATALLFRGTPGYQMAIMLLGLFASYSIQVRVNPYMSPGDYAEVVRQHNVLVSLSTPGKLNDHAKIEELLTAGSTSVQTTAVSFEAAMRTVADREEEAFRFNAASIGAFLVDYNKVETVLLGCGILVNLAGTMFLSERFSASQRSVYQAEYDSLAILTVVIIILSIAYFFTVLGVELLFKMNPAMAARMAACLSPKSARAGKARAKSDDRTFMGSSGSGDAEEGAGTFETNALMTTRADGAGDGETGPFDHISLPPKAPTQADWNDLKLVFEAMRNEHKSLSAELRSTRSAAAKVSAGAAAMAVPGVTGSAAVAATMGRSSRTFRPTRGRADRSRTQRRNPLAARSASSADSASPASSPARGPASPSSTSSRRLLRPGGAGGAGGGDASVA